MKEYIFSACCLVSIFLFPVEVMAIGLDSTQDEIILSQNIVVASFEFEEVTGASVPNIYWGKLRDVSYLKGGGEKLISLRLVVEDEKTLKYLYDLNKLSVLVYFNSDSDRSIGYPAGHSLEKAISRAEDSMIEKLESGSAASYRNCSVIRLSPPDFFKELDEDFLLLQRAKNQNTVSTVYERIEKRALENIRLLFEYYVYGVSTDINLSLVLSEDEEFGGQVFSYEIVKSDDFLSLIFSKATGWRGSPSVNGLGGRGRKNAKDRWMAFFFQKYPQWFECDKKV